MTNCWIHGYGKYFDTRAFGAWAHRGGKILAEDCLFTQSGNILSLGVKNTVVEQSLHPEYIKYLGEKLTEKFDREV